MQDFKQFERWYEATVTDATDRSFALLCQPGVHRVYLYCRPSTANERGTLTPSRFGDEAYKEGYQLVTGQPITGGMSRSRIRAFIHKHGRNAPIVATQADY